MNNNIMTSIQHIIWLWEGVKIWFIGFYVIFFCFSFRLFYCFMHVKMGFCCFYYRHHYWNYVIHIIFSSYSFYIIYIFEFKLMFSVNMVINVSSRCFFLILFYFIALLSSVKFLLKYLSFCINNSFVGKSVR